LWWLWIIILAALLYGGYRFYQAQLQKRAEMAAAQEAKAARHLASVVVASAHLGEMPLTLRGLGSVTAFQTVTVKTRVDGQLTNVVFREGQLVHKGDLLAEIDPRTYQVQLAQAEGQLTKDIAQLKDAQANLDRYKELFADQVIARQQLDTQASLVGQFDGTIAADKAQIDQAKLQLTYCKIVAPISGRIGLRQVDSGNMVHANDTTGIAVITQLQPIAALFSIPEDYLPQVLKRLSVNSHLPVIAYDRDGIEKLAVGTLLTVDNQIDPTTGTSKLKAVFDNADNALFPNQFVNIELHLDTKHGVVIVPASAIQRGPIGTFVYVVKDSKAYVRPVTTGSLLGNDIAIDKGLTNSEHVVVDGADKLTDGIKVDARPMPPVTTGRGSRS
jgi:multidrug efflux system membrane fusion protein